MWGELLTLTYWKKMATDQDILKDFNHYYDEAYTAWGPFLSEAEDDLNFFLGNQWTGSDRSDLFKEGRNAFVFNRIRRVINMVSGYQRKHRLSSIVTPIESSDQTTADQLSQLLLFSLQYGNGYQTISDCFGGALKTGLNLLSIWMDYRDDPLNGDICFGREPYNSFILDPYFTRLDLSDCNYILRRKYLSVEQTISLLPKHKREILELSKFGWERDEKFSWLPYQRLYNGQPMLAYNEVYNQKWKKADVIVDTETGEYTDWNGDEEQFKEFRRLYPQLEIIKKQKRYIERNVIVNDQVMEKEEDPYGLNEYPFIPFISTFEPESNDWLLKVQSLVRCMKDPQRESNKRRSKMVDILESQVNSGWVAVEGSVVNPRSLFQASQGKVIWKTADAPPGALERIQPAQIPPSMFQLQELFDRDILEIAGINEAALGQSDNANESGVLALLRQGAGLINLQDLFDNLRFSQKMVSQKVLKLIQTWSPAKVRKIINQEPTGEFYSKNFTKYDCVVQEGILTDTQRQMFFRQLIDLKNLGEPIPPLLLTKAAPLQGKTELIKEMEAFQMQQAMAAQKQQQIQDQVLQSQSQLSQARAINDIAGAKERFTRAVANLGLEDERAAAAVEDRADAVLKRAKAAKELENIDDERLIKLLDLFTSLEEINRQKEIAIKEDDVTLSSQADQASNLPNQFDPQALGQIQQLLGQVQPQATEVDNAPR